jgi:phage tail-like protein
MRGTIDGLSTPSPLADTLPSVLREDAFAREICASMDEVLAPVLLTLDAFPAYLDLTTTPEDMLPWLAQWLGVAVDPSQELDIQRGWLGSAGELHATRGTQRGIQLAVEAALGMPVKVAETGGAAWSEMPGGELPGEPRPAVVVTVRPGPNQTADPDRVEALVASVTPAHVLHRIHIVTP